MLVIPAIETIQTGLTLCTDGEGGVYIGWKQSTRTDNGDAYVIRLDALGYAAPGWPNGGLPLEVRPGSQRTAKVAPDGLGGIYVVTETNSATFQHRLYRILGNGSLAPGWPAEGISLPISDYWPPDGLCDDGQGGVFVVWHSADPELWILRYGPDGQPHPGWSATPRRLLPNPGPRWEAQIFPSTGGGFLAIWSEQRNGGRVVAGRFLPNGEIDPAWHDGLVVNALPTVQQYTQAIPDGLGGLHVVWSDYRVPVPAPYFPYYYEVYAHHVLFDGTLDSRWPTSGAPLVTGQSSQWVVHMTTDAEGGAIYVWSPGIFAMRQREDGTIPAGWTANGARVATGEISQTWAPIVADDQGGIYTFWSGDAALRGQHLTTDGSRAEGWPQEGRVVGHPVQDVVAISDRAGGAIVAYDRHNVTGPNGIFARHILSDQPVPAAVSLLDAVVEAGTVRLRWTSSSAALVQARVLRRDERTDWVECGRASSSGENLLVFEDAGLAPARYAYRLHFTDDDGTVRSTEETWIEVLGDARLELHGFLPNPSGSRPTVSFFLPGAGSASLGVFDSRGRLVASREVGGLGHGRHWLSLANEHPLAPGVYWIQLRRGAEVRNVRGVVVR